MKLNNRFPEEEKIRCWIDYQYCILCGSNQMCSLHHIDGCKQDYHRSIFNSAMLCHDCHKIADAHNTDSPLSVEYRNKLRTKANFIVEKNKTTKTKYDIAYLENCGQE